MKKYLIMFFIGSFMMSGVSIILVAFLVTGYFPDEIYSIPMGIIFLSGIPIMIIGMEKEARRVKRESL